MDRRIFTKQLLATVSSYALFESLFSSQAFGYPVNPIVTHWAKQLQQFCEDLKKDALNPAEWQALIENLYSKIELDELLRFIDFENLAKGFTYPDLGVHTKAVKFPKLEGLPEKTVFVKKIFGMRKDRSIIPHGHSNMASAHLIIKGEMHLRHYEKVGQDKNHLVIKPSLDKTMRVGDASSISDERDNVHWFIASSETAFTFDVIMLDLKGKPYDIHNIDIYARQDLPDGTMRVPILNVETALKKYGKNSHH